MILTTGLIAGAEMLAIAINMHQLARRSTDETRLAQDKFEELMKLNFATAPAVQISPVQPDPLAQNVANFFDIPAGGLYERRWSVQAGPTATTRLVTVRLVPRQHNDLRMAKPVQLAAVIRQW